MEETSESEEIRSETEDENEGKAKKFEGSRPPDRRSCLFPTTLNKIEEVDESHSKSPEADRKIRRDGRKSNRKWKQDVKKPEGRERPKSAIPASGVEKVIPKKRPKSSGSLFRFDMLSGHIFDIRCLEHHRPRFRDSETLSRSSSSSGSGFCRKRCHTVPENWLTSFRPLRSGFYDGRKCRSNLNFCRSKSQEFHQKQDFLRFRRSLYSLGFEAADFGIFVGKHPAGRKIKLKKPSPTLSTKVFRRTVSLDCLRNLVREAWMDDRLDNCHRKLLSQAAYEEWYFRKEEELWKKKEEEKRNAVRMRESLKRELERKREKAEEEFRKWVQKKRGKGRGEEAKKKTKESENILGRLVKTKEESEKAYVKWKKEKDKENRKKIRDKKEEEERKKESEKEQAEKKAAAEKAFQQWKLKLEEHQRLEMKRRIKNQKKEEELERRKKREEESRNSFQAWKRIKDEEMKRHMGRLRQALRTAKEERVAQLEERMYEAEQAFEEWLEKVSQRKRFHQLEAYQKNVPWLPG